MDSASVSASVTATVDGGKTFSGSSVVQAILRNGGTSWSMTSTFQADGLLFGSDKSSGRLTLLTADGHQFFLKTDDLQGPLSDLMKKTLTGSRNGWWVTGESQSGRLLKTVRSAPAPEELGKAADMFEIIAATPPRRGQDGRLEYRLEVVLSKDAKRALFPPETVDDAAMEGTLLIDAVDFTLKRSSWKIAGVKTSFGLLSIDFDVALKDFDRAPDISLPIGSSATLPLKDFFATISSG